MAKQLPEDFPGRAALEEAGEFTPAKIRKRVEAGTLTEIPGIGEATAEKITTEMALFDSDEQAESMKATEDNPDHTPADDAAKIQSDEGTAEDSGAVGTAAQHEAGAQTKSGPILNHGTNAAAISAGAAEQAKTGAEKNAELPNHALDELTPSERERANVRESTAERIARSGAVYVHDPAGPYASTTAVHIPQSAVRIKVDPIAHVSPLKGMSVKDGNDEYAIQEDLGPDSTGDDWLKVRSPNTGEPFIR